LVPTASIENLYRDQGLWYYVIGKAEWRESNSESHKRYLRILRRKFCLWTRREHDRHAAFNLPIAPGRKFAIATPVMTPGG